jgi:hypothetical protein
MTRTTSRLGRSLAAALAALLIGCNAQDLIRGLIQVQLDRIWSDPARKAEAEAYAEAKIKAAVDSKLGGKEFEVPGPNPYLHHVKSVNVDLGDVAPTIAIPGAVTQSQTNTNYYVSFPWEATWAKGNGAKLDMGLDMRSHSFFLGYGYPDHDVHVRDIVAWAKGTAFAVVPKSGAQGTATITLGGSSIDLKAEAEGWFWSVNVSAEIKKQLNDNVLRQLVGQSIKQTFNAKP